jgi:hypothetical protein
MTLHIADTRITSDEVTDNAELRHGIAGDGSDAWVCWGPTVGTEFGARLFDRDGAISAMTLAEELARPEPNQLLVESLRSELTND